MYDGHFFCMRMIRVCLRKAQMVADFHFLEHGLGKCEKSLKS